jgi:hypothetical protein
MRQAVGLALVHVLRGPDEVFPRVRAAARAGHDVVEAAFGRMQQAAGVLAAVAVALAYVSRVQLRALLRHARVIHRHNHSRHADGTVRSMHELVLRPDWQRDPLVPRDRAHCFGMATFAELDVERGGHVRRHLAKRILRRANVDRLPVAVKHEYDVLVQYFTHTLFTYGHGASPGVCSLLGIGPKCASPCHKCGPHLSKWVPHLGKFDGIYGNAILI